MPEFKKPEPPKPPETKYEVPAAEFIKAVKGEPFTSGNGLYRMKGKEIEAGFLPLSFSFYQENEDEYIILRLAKVIKAESINFLNTELTNYKTNFIFFNSILPGIKMQNTITGDWRLFNSFIIGDILIGENSQAKDVSIDENSQTEDIGIDKNSKIRDIIISDNSQARDIIISDNSQVRDINIIDNSQSSKINIRGNSQSGDINTSENSQSGNVSIRGNSQSRDIRINNNSQSGNIWINNNSQSGFIGINNSSQNGFISIRDNSKIGNIGISNSSQSGFISIRDNSQSGDVWIKDNSQSGFININDDSQSGYIGINSDSQSGYIGIRDNSQSGNIWIRDNSQSGDIIIRENSCTGSIEVLNSSCPQLMVRNNYFSIKLFNAAIPLMNISNSCIRALTWQAGTKGELYISESKINHLNLQHTSLLKDALISITNSQLFIAQMNKLTVQGQLILSKLKHLENPFTWDHPLRKILADKKPGDHASALIKQIHQSKTWQLKEDEDQYNKKKEKLLKWFSEKPLWQMVNSSFGKTEITGCDLRKFKFEYRDSKLLDTFISGTKLPKEKIQIYNVDRKTKLDDVDFFEQKISIYSQLKKIFENQGDIVEATWYHSKSMDNQQLLLQLKYNDAKKKWFSEEGFDLFNFKINKWTNNHGESWRKALWFVLISSLIVYSLYFMSINYHKDFSYKGIGNFIGRFFSFLNFTRREDFMAEKEELNAFSYFFDYLGRVVTGFGIYQLIAAFRRHGRK
jgi:hypothetical protein